MSHFIRKIAFALLALVSASVFAAVEANKADRAQLESVKGVGSALSGRIVAERQKAPFKDWNDFITRVQGVGPASAARLSREGLTVNGTSYPGAQPAAKQQVAAKPPARPADRKQ
ncbi:helix-hairpin-helix domain-containing protein [Caldimonas thermodepolymerans]|jgi:competence protein ComEA|uniref:Competence protein ComEA n=1 Tax=Caldimonas thermodepolymerans TaxID=215580 RepID=A0A2S5T339_9BURK|nr:helix-hairpin-helix domain-containing protein [Caldimonas thermodepolymerans]PPE69405.1 hypothetical protein C1702_11925 [Caldimonas thermodepolymerans]QPC32755.1 helix-hairpin-helix domain-containing protein [Caldimonas thermodepolymerans]RDI03518.1 competence protein ComEA [Caldimonas thermodepolymerans]TCP06623.1 competence protein ComEA [Caldimonas thermodepolymerans]UZG45564.1 helix-hairpin-helix domain-containing protein [Caldimonas thermodepolymerans]